MFEFNGKSYDGAIALFANAVTEGEKEAEDLLDGGEGGDDENGGAE